MNRSLTAIFASLEAALVAAIGIAIPLAPLTLLWALQFGFNADWAGFWRASVDIWLLGHGADLHVELVPEIAASLGVTDEQSGFTLTIAALGFAVLTFALALRAGRRVAETKFRSLGEVVAIVTFFVIALGVTLTADFPYAQPALVQGALLPTVVFAVGVLLGAARTRRAIDDEDGSSIADWVNDWRPETRATWVGALKGGTAAVAALLAVASLVFSVLLAINYARIIALYEGLHTQVLGGISLTLAQLAFLPNIVIWSASWLVGPGFAIGSGSTVSPIATQLGPVPAIPVLGALPEGSFTFGFVGLIVPVLAGFLVAIAVRPGLAAHPGEQVRARVVVATGIGIGLIGGLIIGLLAWFSAGAAGPGRLVDVGPDPLAVGGWAALEFAIGAIIGLFTAGREPADDEEASTDAER